MIAIFPEIINLVLNQDVERLAYAVRKYHGYPSSRAPVLDLDKMLENIGIQCGNWQMQDLAGIVAQDQGGSFQVSMGWPEAMASESELRYLKAYLLGRFYLDLSPAIASSGELSGGYKIDRKCWRELASGGSLEGQPSDDLGWRQAHAFAQSLLLPKAMVRKAWAVIGNRTEVARFFAVTEQFLQARLNESEAKLDSTPPMSSRSNLAETKQPDRSRKHSHTTMTPEANKKAPAKVESNRSPQALKSGLARLRQLAKQMDPSVDTET